MRQKTQTLQTFICSLSALNIILYSLGLIGVFGDTITTVYIVTSGSGVEANPISLTTMNTVGILGWAIVATSLSLVTITGVLFKPHVVKNTTVLFYISLFIVVFKLALTLNNLTVIYQAHTVG